MLLDTRRKYRLLVLCTGNSARSIMAEALFSTLGASCFEAWSAGSRPAGQVNPFALEQLASLQLATQPRSKSWDEFAQQDAPAIDIVLAVCDNAASEECPAIAGRPRSASWCLPDPAAVVGSDASKRRAFAHCFAIFEARIRHLLQTLDRDHPVDMVELLNETARVIP